jgi:LPXTG-motif cell wall-anchored protein
MRRPARTALTVPTLTLALLLGASATQAQPPGRAPTCDDLVWSAQVLAANPDIDDSCQGVYQRGNELFARVEITLTRVRGNRLTFRPQHLDGTQGKARSIVVPNSWRATIDGSEYRARDLMAGQKLSVYIPEDRFALALGESTLAGEEDIELIEIEEAAVVSSMPKTASALPSAFLAGLLLLGSGLLLRARRRAQRSP